MNCVIDRMTPGDWEQVRSIYLESIKAGRRERIATLNSVWRDTLLFERRSKRVGL